MVVTERQHHTLSGMQRGFGRGDFETTQFFEDRNDLISLLRRVVFVAPLLEVQLLLIGEIDAVGGSEEAGIG